MDMAAIPYVPTGWTLDRLNRADPSDLATLSPGDLDRIFAGYEALDQVERSGEEQSAWSIPRENQSATSQLVEIVERQSSQMAWGYLLFRMDYNDERQWDTFEEGFNNLIDQSIRDDTGFARIAEGLMIKMVVDEALQGTSLAQVQEHFQNLKEAGEVPAGLDVSMCLVVDTASMASVTDQDATPFVMALATDTSIEDDEFTSKPVFKAAITSLLPDLYPLLASQALTPNELGPFANPVFTNAYGIEEKEKDSVGGSPPL